MEQRNIQQWEPADITIHIRDKGVVLREKSLVAYETSTGKIVAVGTEAEALKGRSSGGICVSSPLRRGMIADYPEAVCIFTELFRRALGKKRFLKPFITVIVPERITNVEKKALEDAMLQSGAGNVRFFTMPMEQYLRDVVEQQPDLYQKYKVTIGISKDEPERYVKEALGQILSYAAQEGITEESVQKLLESVRASDAGAGRTHNC